MAAPQRSRTLLAAHPDVAPEDVLAVLPAFERLQGDEILGRLLSALDRRGIVTPELLRRLAAIHMQRGQFAIARETLERVASRPASPQCPSCWTWRAPRKRPVTIRERLATSRMPARWNRDNAAVHFLFGVVCVSSNSAPRRTSR